MELAYANSNVCHLLAMYSGSQLKIGLHHNLSGQSSLNTPLLHISSSNLYVMTWACFFFTPIFSAVCSFMTLFSTVLMSSNSGPWTIFQGILFKYKYFWIAMHNWYNILPGYNPSPYFYWPQVWNKTWTLWSFLISSSTGHSNLHSKLIHYNRSYKVSLPSTYYRPLHLNLSWIYFFFSLQLSSIHLS